MAQSKAATVQEYLEELPPERRLVIERVRAAITAHLPAGYREGMSYGMVGYSIPLERFPDTYNQQPLLYVGLAAQKNYCALYLNGIYQDPEQEQRLRDAFTQAGLKLDMGKSCVRFRQAEDLPLEAIGQLIASVPPDSFIAGYEAARAQR